MLTKQDCEKSHKGQIFHHVFANNADGTPVRCRVNGKCKTLKKQPEDFRLPVKHGLADYFAITPGNAEDWNRAA
jgi:hypothetical protein